MIEHRFQAKECYEEQDLIEGPWYVEDCQNGYVVAEGLSNYQAIISALSRTLSNEIEQYDFEGCTVAELYLEIGTHIS